MKFSMTVEFGNAAMLTSDDLAQAMRQAADRIESNDYVGCVENNGAKYSIVRGVTDENGNRVGQFIIESEEGADCKWIVQIGREEDAEGYSYANEDETESYETKARAKAKIFNTRKEALKCAELYTWGRAVRK